MALSAELSTSLNYYVGQELFDSRACNGQDPNTFFPEFDKTVISLRKKEIIGQAAMICQNCPIMNECLDWALANGEKYGIWGGVYLENYYKRPRSR